jgi:hypothetical protein
MINFDTISKMASEYGSKAAIYQTRINFLTKKIEFDFTARYEKLRIKQQKLDEKKTALLAEEASNKSELKTQFDQPDERFTSLLYFLLDLKETGRCFLPIDDTCVLPLLTEMLKKNGPYKFLDYDVVHIFIQKNIVIPRSTKCLEYTEQDQIFCLDAGQLPQKWFKKWTSYETIKPTPDQIYYKNQQRKASCQQDIIVVTYVV